MLTQFGVIAWGPYQGGLSSEGERVALEDRLGVLVDEVTYQPRFPWPIGADGTGASMELIGPYAQNFANSGEEVTVQTSAGGTDIVSFAYQDGQGWPARADGLGYSLVPLVLEDQAEGTLNEGKNWRASAEMNGSPGGPDL